MTDTRALNPQVESFVAQVRARLGDLSEEEREELLGGLEADLSDQLADGAPDLGDPAQYAAELRTAAGLPATTRRPVPRPLLPSSAEVTEHLDEARRLFLSTVQQHRWTREAWGVVAALRPAWWVARGWLAVTLLDQALGPWEYVTLVPSFNVPGAGAVLLLAAVLLSVLLGQGRLGVRGGPGAPAAARGLVLALNVAALAATGPVVGKLPDVHVLSYARAGSYPMPMPPDPGLQVDGEPVRNVFAYGADGQPLTGVQLFAGDGRQLAVDPRTAASGRGAERTVGCGWVNGTTELFNVFPLPQREQRHGTCRDDDPDHEPATEPEAPYAQVPPVTSPVLAPVEAEAACLPAPCQEPPARTAPAPAQEKAPGDRR